MVYTLTRGAQGYNTRLHYSLYGGVEYFPDRSLALKELLPLVAVPAVAIALLVAIINFHIPILSPQTQSGSSDTGANLSRSAVTSSLITHSAPNTTNTNGNTSATKKPAATAASTGSSSSSAPSAINIITGGMGGGEDNGQGIITPPSGGTTPIPTPPSSGSTTTTVDTGTPVGSVSASADLTQPTSPQAGVDVTVPLTSTNVSLGTSSLGL